MPLILCQVDAAVTLLCATIWKHVIIVQVRHETVRLMLRQLDPASVIYRRQHRLHRWTYHSHEPDDTWHVDGYDNLSWYGFCINGWVSNDYIWYCYIPKWLTYCSDGERNAWWTVLVATTFDALCAIYMKLSICKRLWGRVFLIARFFPVVFCVLCNSLKKLETFGSKLGQIAVWLHGASPITQRVAKVVDCIHNAFMFLADY